MAVQRSQINDIIESYKDNSLSFKYLVNNGVSINSYSTTFDTPYFLKLFDEGCLTTDNFKDLLEILKLRRASAFHSALAEFVSPLSDTLLRLFEKSYLSLDNLCEIMKSLDTAYEISMFSYNQRLMNIAFDNFLFDSKTVEKFESTMKNSQAFSSFWKDSISYFDFLDTLTASRALKESSVQQRVYEQNNNFQTYKFVCRLCSNVCERFEMINQLKDSKDFQQKLLYIIENNLENTFKTSTELLSYLTKKDRKHSLCF